MGRGKAHSSAKGQKGRDRFTHHKGAHGRNRQSTARVTGKTTKGGDKKGS